MGQKITVVKALCSLRGGGVASYLAGCSVLFQFPPLPMWRECLKGKRESPYGVSGPGRINYFPVVHPPKSKEPPSREERMSRAIDIFNKVDLLTQCGLWLFSHIDVEDSNLIWCLIQTADSGRKTAFNYRNAAAYRIKHHSENWKNKTHHVETLRKCEQGRLRACWGMWKPKLEECLASSRKNNQTTFDTYEKVFFYAVAPKRVQVCLSAA